MVWPTSSTKKTLGVCCKRLNKIVTLYLDVFGNQCDIGYFQLIVSSNRYFCQRKFTDTDMPYTVFRNYLICVFDHFYCEYFENTAKKIDIKSSFH